MEVGPEKAPDHQGSEFTASTALPPRYQPSDYSSAFSNVLAKVCRQKPDGRISASVATRLAADLLAADRRTVEKLLAPGLPYASWEVFQSLIDEALPATFERPVAGQAVARMALRVSTRMSPDQVGCALIADAKGLALIYLANAYRVGSDLARAEELLDLAGKALESGTGDPLGRILILRIRACIGRDQNHSAIADEYCAEALRLSREIADPHLEGHVEFSRGVFRLHFGDYEGARELLESAADKIDVKREPRLLLLAQHAYVSTELGRGNVDAAEAQMGSLRRLHEQFPDVVARARLHWLEARLATARGRLEEAERYYQTARSAFLDHGIKGDAALITRELAELYLKSA